VTGVLFMSIPQRCRLRVSWLMEAVAALAIAFAFWKWLQTPAFDAELVGASYTNLELLRPRIVLAALSTGVTLLALFVIASVLFRAVKGDNRKLDRWTKGLGLLNLVIVLWFLSIETTSHRETCATCFNVRYVCEWRAFSWVIRRDVRQWNSPTIRELIAADLGMPCWHPKRARRCGWSSSGLCLVKGVCLLTLSDGRVYPPCARSAVCAWLARDPSLPATLRKRVFEENDRAYWRAFFDRIYGECPESEIPERLRSPKRSS
jgi:hypothetical protein